MQPVAAKKIFAWITLRISAFHTRSFYHGSPEYTIAFSYPKDTDYIKATITKGNDKKSFTIDIRDFK